MVDYQCLHILHYFREDLLGAGGVVSFTGYVRDFHEDKSVTGLVLEAYPELTEKAIEEEIATIKAQWSLLKLEAVHRTGLVKKDDPIVWVAAASPHRRAAFEAADCLMDYLKTKALLWKKEIRETTEEWIKPREEDYNRAKRWEKE